MGPRRGDGMAAVLDTLSGKEGHLWAARIASPCIVAHTARCFVKPAFHDIQLDWNARQTERQTGTGGLPLDLSDVEVDSASLGKFNTFGPLGLAIIPGSAQFSFAQVCLCQVGIAQQDH